MHDACGRLYGHPGMAEEGVTIVHPNRDKPVVKATKFTVILLLLASAGLILIITLGGWKTLEGAKLLQIFYIVLYLVFAFYTARWNRGVLPVAAAFAIILTIFALVAGPAWFDRDKDGFTNPALNESILGMLTLLLIPVQILLIAFSMRGFTQDWHVEVERREGEADRPTSGARAATA
jgi:presenilin-like A22 family membrane protease